MPLGQLLLPEWLRRIDGKKPDHLVGVVFRVLGDFLVRHPKPGQPRLAAKDDGLVAPESPRVVFLPADGQVDFLVPGVARLFDEVF